MSILDKLESDVSKYISINETPMIGINTIKNENSAADLRSIFK